MYREDLRRLVNEHLDVYYEQKPEGEEPSLENFSRWLTDELLGDPEFLVEAEDYILDLKAKENPITWELLNGRSGVRDRARYMEAQK